MKVLEVWDGITVWENDEDFALVDVLGEIAANATSCPDCFSGRLTEVDTTTIECRNCNRKFLISEEL